MDLRDRLLLMADHYKLSVREFEKECGLKRGNVSNMTGAIGSDKLSKIIDRFSDVNLYWLISGNGNIFNTKSAKNVVNKNDYIDDHKIDHKRKVYETWSNESDRDDYPYVNIEGIGVPYYDVDFCGGFDLVFNDQTRNPDSYIYFPQYDKADSWANITGHSMEPLISNGDIIALKKMENWSVYILYGEVYGIMTDEYRTVKRLRRSKDPKTIILEPINRNGYDDQEIPREIITGVWKVLGCVKKMF